MNAPPIDWFALAPILIPLGAAVLAVLLEVFIPARFRRLVQMSWALTAITASGVWALIRALKPADEAVSAVGGHVLVDPLTLFVQIAIALSAILAIIVIADRTRSGEDAFSPQPAAAPGSPDEEEALAAKLVHTEAYPLVLFATGGMMLFPAAGDLLTLFVALEALSLPLYLLTALARHRRALSHEASLKYFLLGAFASAVFLFGASWVYGATGTVRFLGIAEQIQGQGLGADPMLFAGFAMLLVGFAFKVGAVPFHAWTPDVYQGAPAPITAFMAACTKIAAFGALLRFAYSVLAYVTWDVTIALWTVAIATMVVGTALAMVQRNIVRMLAYSAIAHTGFILTGLVAFSAEGISSTLFYLLVYGVATVGAFSVVAAVRLRSGTLGAGALTFDSWAGLGRQSPILATAMTLFLLSFAGIPLTSGFVAKFGVFAAAFSADAMPVAIVGIACSAAAALFYARLIYSMFFAEPAEALDAGERTQGLTNITIAACAVITLALGLWPAPLLDFATKAAALLP
ncbi:MAG: NADH-quinone oxidoreductase subunit NuoN [Micrococcales bacterium]|nr:NADH-quinone oxidoreductase subunit NuoN [Micrococcales bacterium]